MQTGRQNSALLSGMMGSAPGVDSFDSLVNGGTQGNSIYANYANPQAALTSAEAIIRATGSAQPRIQDTRLAHLAYLMEIQAQSQINQTSFGSNPLRSWFA